jgi:hypothetical protein
MSFSTRESKVATKDVSDRQVCEVVRDRMALLRRHRSWGSSVFEMLSERTGQPEKVCLRAMERAERHGLLEYAISLRSAWLTPAGKELLSRGGEKPWSGRTEAWGEPLIFDDLWKLGG